MKTITLLLAALLFVATGRTQNLIDIYKKGTVKLEADPQFGKNNDWNKVFATYNDSMGSEHIGKRKSLVILPDGSFVVNHAYQQFFTKFSPQGNFVKEFSIKSSSGKVLKTPAILGVLDNTILYTGVTNYGKMFCTDLNGNLLKTLNVNYMASTIIPLPNRKFAIVGWVIWKNKFRDFVAIKDYATGEEKVIWDHFTNRNTDVKEVQIPNPTGERSSFKIFAAPINLGFRPRPNIVLTPQNELLLTIPPTGELIYFGLNGEKLRTTKVNWQNEKIPAEEMQKSYQANIERMKEYANNERLIELYGKEGAKLYTKELIKQYEKNKSQYTAPKDQPYFSTIIKDSDNNLLFFEFPKEEGANSFNVYTFSGKGQFVCKSSFRCDNYNLEINPGKLVFRNGFLYGLQELKNASGIPMRLVKFKLESAN